MALRGSLPSMLNSRINTGPDINITKRTGLNLAKGISGGNVPQREFTDSTAHDIEDNRIMLNECDTEYTAQIQTCVAKDTVVCGANDSFVENSDHALGDIDFGCGQAIKYLVDLRHSQYIRDIGDARNELEYFLRARQVALFFPGYTAEYFQPHLLVRKKDTTQTTTRRISIIFSKDEASFPQDLFLSEPHKGTRTQFPFYKATVNKDTTKNVFWVKIRHDLEPNPETLVEPGSLNFMNVLSLVKDVLDSLKQAQLAYVSTVRNESTVMPPKALAFSGMSLTYGYMSPKNGDTALTANLFSARTDRNGPFRAHGGDDVYWLYNCELEMFDNSTHRRHERPVLTPQLLDHIAKTCITGPVGIPVFSLPQLDMCMRPDPLAEAPGAGNKQYPPFVLAVAPHSHSLCSFSTSTSLCDLERRIGKIISGGPPSSQIYWINGAGTEL